MKIIILANSDIASNYALNLLLPKIKTHQLRLYLSESVGKLKQKPEALLSLQFFEQSLFNQLLFPLISNQKNLTNARFKPFQQLNKYLDQPLTTISNINSLEVYSEFKKFDPDLIISIRFGQILKQEIISTSKKGVINLHSGKLPQYQGVMPTFQAMLNGESEIGTTLHFIQDNSIDSGDIIETTTIKLQQHSYLWHVLKLYEEGTEIILQAIITLERDQCLAAQPQQADANYYSFPDSLQITKFIEQGWKLYDVEEILILASQYIVGIE